MFLQRAFLSTAVICVVDYSKKSRLNYTVGCLDFFVFSWLIKRVKDTPAMLRQPVEVDRGEQRVAVPWLLAVAAFLSSMRKSSLRELLYIERRSLCQIL